MLRTLSLVALLFLPGCTQSAQSQEAPPAAAEKPKELTAHGETRIDPYYWLNERENPEVIAYLEAENAYTEQAMAGTKELQAELYEELTGRLDPNDESVPYLYDGYWYYTRYTPGGDYKLHCRKKGSLESEEEILADGNAMAKGHPYFSLTGLTVNSDNELMAYATDTLGRRKYDIHFKNLKTGEVLEHSIPQVSGDMEWAEGSRVLFYARQDPETLRRYQIWRHEVGANKPDVLVFQEDDDTYWISLMKAKSRDYLMIECEQTLATEYLVLRADEPMGEWKVFEARERDHEYQLDHVDGRFLIRTNWQAKDFRLMATTQMGREHWTDVVEHRPGTFLESFEGFNDYLVVRERRGGLQHFVVHPEGGEAYELEFADPTYGLYWDSNFDPASTTLRYEYSSMTTPWTVYDFDMAARNQKQMKQDKVLGGFDPNDYESQYVWATARDGAKVPISVVYRKDRLARGQNPMLLYSYGSYGSSSRATFDASRLSLLDRGFVWATAHIRGGQEMGREWYEDGKMLNKKNTFTDFIDAGRFLAAEDWCDESRIYCYGGSAGGLLVGAAINMAPELFHGALARVPFVDVVTTMLDESIPLTSGEWDEWGDPRKKVDHDYMLSYSPYDQIEAKDYPNLLVTAGLHDSQVQYFEPAKWVAKLRKMKTDDNLLLLYTNMEAGHGGASGRLSKMKERALLWAFVVDLAGRGVAGR